MTEDIVKKFLVDESTPEPSVIDGLSQLDGY